MALEFTNAIWVALLAPLMLGEALTRPRLATAGVIVVAQPGAATAPASIVAPMEFLQLPLIALIGMWIYAEPLGPAVFIGSALIVAGNLVNLHAATRRRAPT